MAIINDTMDEMGQMKGQFVAGTWADAPVTVHKMWLKTGRETYWLHTAHPVQQFLVHGSTSTAAYSTEHGVSHGAGWLMPLSSTLINKLKTQQGFTLIAAQLASPFECTGSAMQTFTAALSSLENTP